MFVTENNWFTFLLAIIITLLGALGAVMIVMNKQIWLKLDRITSLFLHERDIMRSEIKCVSDKQEQVKDELKDRIHKIEVDQK